MSHVFISYNREDQYRARAIADGLEAEGISVWWDTNLRAGESYDEVTEKNLRSAGAVVVLWSSRSVNSKWVRAEATIGERYSKLVPAMIEDCDRPLRFELVHTADLSNWHGDKNDPNWRDFLNDIKEAIGHQHEAPSTPAPAAPMQEAGGSTDVTIENTFWNSIKDGTDPSEFEAYLKRYPNGHFADLAHNRLNALKKAQAAPKKPASPPPRTGSSAAKTNASATKPASAETGSGRSAKTYASSSAASEKGRANRSDCAGALSGWLL